MAWCVNWKVAKWTQVGRKNQWRTHSFVRSCVICSQLVRWNLGHFESFRFWHHPKFRISALPCNKLSYQVRYHFKDNKTAFLMRPSTCRFLFEMSEQYLIELRFPNCFEDYKTSVILQLLNFDLIPHFSVLHFHVRSYCNKYGIILKNIK